MAVYEISMTTEDGPVTFRPDGTGFAGVYRTDGVAGYILISTDAGQTWYENFNPETGRA